MPPLIIRRQQVPLVVGLALVVLTPAITRLNETKSIPLAEQAQDESRQLVRDLRFVSVGEELENARGVLEAAQEMNRTVGAKP